MNAQEIKNRIESTTYYENRYIKSSALNICDAALKSEFLSVEEKKEIRIIKLDIEKINDPWLWNSKADLFDLNEITAKLNEIYALLE